MLINILLADSFQTNHADHDLANTSERDSDWIGELPIAHLFSSPILLRHLDILSNGPPKPEAC